MNTADACLWCPSKSISYAVWYPDIARAHVTLSRGIHFATMGHSIARATPKGGANKTHKRLELLPEETLYLVERGAILCWKASDLVLTDALGLDDVEGIPMTVQQAYTEMIGTEDLSLEKYQVIAYGCYGRRRWLTAPVGICIPEKTWLCRHSYESSESRVSPPTSL